MHIQDHDSPQGQNHQVQYLGVLLNLEGNALTLLCCRYISLVHLWYILLQWLHSRLRSPVQ